MRLTQNDLSALTDSRDFYYLSGLPRWYYSFGLNLDPDAIHEGKGGAYGSPHRPCIAWRRRA